MKELLRVDLGCGGRKKDGWLGIDVAPGDAVDIVHDVTLGLPLRDNSVIEMYSYHMLEHLDRKHYANLFAELFRVCAPDAILSFWFPYWTHRTAYNFSHVTRINEHSFEGPGFQQYFETLDVGYVYEDGWANKPAQERDFARLHYMNVVREMHIKFRPRK